MLAYAFWHWRRPEVSALEYEARQRAFQSALFQHPPEGFLDGTTVRQTGAPWAADGGESYEDWYQVRGFEDLDRLNEAAVTAARRLPHDEVARLVAGGTAGLYRLSRGTPLSAAKIATWFTKPSGRDYRGFLDQLAPLVSESGGALWMRQMVLGPTPEFCLHSRNPVVLPGECSPVDCQRSAVWPAKPPLA